MSKKGFTLILVILIVMVVGILGLALLSRSISESYVSQTNLEATQTFWLAEAGINRALSELKTNYNQSGANLWRTALAQGGYSVDVAIEGEDRKITSHGFIPFTGTMRIERIIEALMRKNIPPNFYDNAIYTAGDAVFKGNSYSITGKVRYADTPDIEHPENIKDESGQVIPAINDPSISPLARLNFQQLLSVSQSQNNVYVYNTQGKLVNQATGQEAFPVSFWYTAPTNPSDPTTGIPNVVYVNGDLELQSDIGTIGGFYVVVGDVITNPGATYDATINGHGTIDGAVYTRGEFRINGGGGDLNINGGVWAGEQARLNGNANVIYNSDYMSAIKALGIDADVQIIFWKEQSSLYQLIP